MYKSGLIEAFKTFSAHEIKQFSEFVESPYFNKNVNVIKLFEIIKKNYPDFEEDKIEKEKVYKKIFPGKPYKDSTMRLLMFYLYEVVEKFLAYTHFESNKLTYTESLVNELRNRGLYKEFEKNIEKINQEIEKIDIKDENFYLNRFIFRYEYLSYASNFLNGKYEKFVGKDDIEFISQNLTYFYLIRILKFYSIALNMMHLYNIKIETSIFENIMHSFNPDAFKHIPMIGIYFNAIMILLKPDEEEYYFKLKDLVTENSANLPKDSISDIYINLENYCHRKGRTGSVKFLHEALEIYNLEIKSGTCFYNGQIPYSFYNSYVVTACRLSEFEKADSFIENYKPYLGGDYVDGYYLYSKAFLENYKGNHEKALEFLAKVKIDDMYIKMDIRVLLCKIYFELRWHMPLQSLLDTFKKTVQNNKLMPDIRKKYFLLFIKYLNQLNNLAQKQDTAKADELLSNLEADEFFPNKIWLESKVKELMS
jgi:hypothetical protein